MQQRALKAPLLVMDTASPVVSLALGSPGHLVAERNLELRRSSERLLATIEELLAELQIPLGELQGIVALRGPGSFTGLRVGLATALGLHQATGIPTLGLPTLDVLAAAARRHGGAAKTSIWSAVDAIRGEWMVQPFEPEDSPNPSGPPRLVAAEDLPSLGEGLLIGFGVSALGLADDGPGPRPFEPSPLATVALATLNELASPPAAWDAATLSDPIYFRAPAASLPSVPR